MHRLGEILDGAKAHNHLAGNELDIYGQGIELQWFNVTANEGNRITPSHNCLAHDPPLNTYTNTANDRLQKTKPA